MLKADGPTATPETNVPPVTEIPGVGVVLQPLPPAVTKLRLFGRVNPTLGVVVLL